MNDEYLPETYGFKLKSDRELLNEILDSVKELAGGLKAENERLRAALNRIFEAHEKHGGDDTEYMYHTYQEIEKIKQELK